MGGEIDFMCRKDGQYKVQTYGIEDTFGTYLSIIFPQPTAVFSVFTMVYTGCLNQIKLTAISRNTSLFKFVSSITMNDDSF